MSKVNMSTSLGVPADKVWEMIGGFNALANWHPAIETSELEEGGTIRRLNLVGGGAIVEKLEQMDDDGYLYRYSILESPLPVAGYVSEIHVVEDGEGSCKVEWSSNFTADGAPENDATEVIQGIYQAGFDNLKKIFGA